MLQALNIHCYSPLSTYYFTHDKQAHVSAFYLLVTKHACENDDLQMGLTLRAINLHSLLALLLLKRKKLLQAKSGCTPLLLAEHCCTRSTINVTLLWIRMQEMHWVKLKLHLIWYLCSKTEMREQCHVCSIQKLIEYCPEQPDHTLKLDLHWVCIG